MTSEGTGDGILIVNKPAGMTSHDVVNKMRRLYQTRQVGHTGTLDPMATGVLTVLIGRAVKASEYAMCDDKIYEAGLKLGLTTDTEDIWGQTLTKTEGPLPSPTQVRDAAAALTGEILQVPPMYSALKQNGQKLVDLARKGVSVEREARPVMVYELSVTPVDEVAGDYSLRVHCGKGTYIRTLCADLGRSLGCGGVMSGLKRVRSGTFDLSEGHTVEEIESMTPEERNALLRPAEALFTALPAVILPPFFARLAHCGADIYQKKITVAYEPGQRVRLLDEKGFFALAEAAEREDGRVLKPIKQFRLEETV